MKRKIIYILAILTGALFAFSSLTENRTQLLPKDEKQRLALFPQEVLSLGNRQTTHHLQENILQKYERVAFLEE